MSIIFLINWIFGNLSCMKASPLEDPRVRIKSVQLPQKLNWPPRPKLMMNLGSPISNNIKTNISNVGPGLWNCKYLWETGNPRSTIPEFTVYQFNDGYIHCQKHQFQCKVLRLTRYYGSIEDYMWNLSSVFITDTLLWFLKYLLTIDDHLNLKNMTWSQLSIASDTLRGSFWNAFTVCIPSNDTSWELPFVLLSLHSYEWQIRPTL